MEERVSGFEVSGSWTDVVELGERITEAMKDAGVHDPDQASGAHFARAFEEWEKWRLKAHERLDEEMSSKTSAQASVDEGAGERSGTSASADLHNAGEKLEAASDELRDDESTEAIDRMQESLGHAKRAVDTTGRQTLRSIEDSVYQDVMTQFAPYHFDNELVSANIRQTNRLEDGDEFVFEVNINDDELKAAVSDTLSEYEESVDRWHIDIPKDTSSLEAAENADVPG
ncbi:DUF5828 family protein [Natrinema zhouii]|uniref:Uncharacterized protein n=1 Tax=Natrinema zhouii TaxID=1710539 RepID=A0A7D6CQU3_9EURY|nr:DUF5828 family protein [Natrinema zhouii]QLK27777.1 DUF5828 family protein [Natrinema zhouii]